MQPAKNAFPQFNRALCLGMGFFLFGFNTSGQQTKPDSRDSVFECYSTISPEFSGGHKGLLAYLKREVNYPDSAAKANIVGKVFISFLIDEKGQVSQPIVLKALGYGCDTEAIRVINAMPRWKPGTRWSGEPIPVKYNIPVTFTPK